MLENEEDSIWPPLCTVRVGPMWHVLGLWPLLSSHEDLTLVGGGVRAEDLRGQQNRNNRKTKGKNEERMKKKEY